MKERLVVENDDFSTPDIKNSTGILTFILIAGVWSSEKGSSGLGLSQIIAVENSRGSQKGDAWHLVRGKIDRTSRDQYWRINEGVITCHCFQCSGNLGININCLLYAYMTASIKTKPY